MIKTQSVRVVDTDSGVVADITPTTITVSGSKIKLNEYGYGGQKSDKFFTFQNSKPETVELIAKTLLAFVEAQRALKPEDFTA